MFHNTINLEGFELYNANDKTNEQEKIVHLLFEKNPGIKWTPSKAHEILTDYRIIHPRTPLTSIRRAITNLTNDGYLTKLDEYEKGSFGIREHLWMLKQKVEQGTFF
jgi:hypothetical protein